MRRLSSLAESPPFIAVLVLAALAYLGFVLFVSQPPRAVRILQSQVAGITDRAPAATPAPSVPRAAATLEVLLGPDEDYSPLGSLPRGAPLDVVGRDDTSKWIAIVFTPDSKLNAWVPASQVIDVDIAKLPIVPVTRLEKP